MDFIPFEEEIENDPSKGQQIRNSAFKKISQEINKINVQFDRFKDSGFQNTSLKYETTQIVVFGEQSAGKSSTIDSIIGRQISVVGSGCQTRVAIEYRIRQIKKGEKEFLRFKIPCSDKFEDEKYYEGDEEKIEKKMRELQIEISGSETAIVEDENKKIVVEIYTQHCPNLTIIDLPGITVNALQGQPENIEQQILNPSIIYQIPISNRITTELTEKFIKNPKALLLCVMDGNIEFGNQKMIKLAEKYDKEGKRTIGVLTKVDCSSKSVIETYEKEFSQKNKLRIHSFFPITNYTQKDKENKITMQQAQEISFRMLENHWFFQKMINNIGIQNLQNYLAQILYEMIIQNIPKIYETLLKDQDKLQKQIEQLNRGMPKGNEKEDKENLVYFETNQYIQNVISLILKGKRSNQEEQQLNKPIVGMSIINNSFNKNFEEKLQLSFETNINEKLTCNEILQIQRQKFKNYQGFNTAYSTFLATYKKYLKTLVPICKDQIEEVQKHIWQKILQEEAKYTLLPNFSKAQQFMLKNILQILKNQFLTCEKDLHNLFLKESYIFTESKAYEEQYAKLAVDTLNRVLCLEKFDLDQITMKEIITGNLAIKKIQDNTQINYREEEYKSVKLVKDVRDKVGKKKEQIVDPEQQDPEENEFNADKFKDCQKEAISHISSLYVQYHLAIQMLVQQVPKSIVTFGVFGFVNNLQNEFTDFVGKNRKQIVDLMEEDDSKVRLRKQINSDLQNIQSSIAFLEENIKDLK